MRSRLPFMRHILNTCVSKRAIIIGAGPAGLTAALEFLRNTDITPIVLEASQEIGGISRTIRYKGNRMDIGGHRFFSKSDRVMQWWMDLMPPETADAQISYQGQQRVVAVPAHLPEEPPLRGLGPLTHERPPIRVPHISILRCGMPPRSRDRRRPATRRPRPRHARPPAQEPHLLSAQILRLPHQAQRHDHREPRPGAHGAHRRQLHRLARTPHPRRKVARRLPHQPLRPRALPHLLQELHGEGLGHALRQDLRRVGRAAHQGPLAHHRAQALSAQGLHTRAQSSRRRHRPKVHRHLAHRALPLSQVRPRPALGARRRKGRRPRRRAPPRREGRQHRDRPRRPHARPRRRHRQRHRHAHPLRRRLLSLHDAHARPHPRARHRRRHVPAAVSEVAEGLEYRDFITVGILANKLDVEESDTTLGGPA